MSRISKINWYNKIGFDPDRPNEGKRAPDPLLERWQDLHGQPLAKQILSVSRWTHVIDLVVILGIWIGADYLNSLSVVEAHIADRLAAFLLLMMYIVLRLLFYSIRRNRILDWQIYSLMWKQNILHQRMTGLEVERVAYRLSIEMAPDWERLYQMLFEIEDDEQLRDQLVRLTFEARENDQMIFGSRFVFEEEYDSFSGRTKRVGKRISSTGRDTEVTNDFRFEGSWFSSSQRPLFKERQDRRVPSYLHVDEQSINAAERQFFDFPLTEVFSFINAVVFKVNRSFSIIKWPDRVEEALKEQRIEYDKPTAGPGMKVRPDSDIVKLDKSFSDCWGNPVVSKSPARSSGLRFVFHSELVTHYVIDVRFFDPQNNLVPGEGLKIRTSDWLHTA